MPDKTLRALGAIIVLMVIALTAMAQMGSADPSTIALEPEAVVTTQTAPRALDGGDPTTTTTSPPFIYRIGVLSGLTTDNFWAFYGEPATVWDSYVLGPTKPALFRLDSLTGSLVPELAVGVSEPTWDEDGWRVRVALNESFTWSDGTPITADDLVFTFDTVRALGLGGSWATSFPGMIESLHADSPTRLRIEFTERPTYAVWPNAIGTAPLMASHIWGDRVQDLTAEGLYELSGSGDVGGGPLSLLTAGPDVITSGINPGYPLETPPDIVEYHILGDEGTAMAALIDGDIDTILTPRGLSADHLVEVEHRADIDVIESPANSIRYLGFNMKRQPMGDRAFRSAVALLLDRRALADEYADGGAVADSFVGESSANWYDEAAAETIHVSSDGDLQTRLAKAVGGLEEAGYAWDVEPTVSDSGVVPGSGLTINGREPAPLTILTAGDSYDPARPEYVKAIATTIGLLGFDVKSVVTDFDTVVDLAFAGDDDEGPTYDMYFLGWTLGNPALPDFYRPLFGTDGTLNNTGFASSEFDEALSAYEGSYTYTEARHALWAMEGILAEELPYLLLYRGEIIEAYRSDHVQFDDGGEPGGLQGRLGAIGDVAQSP